MSEIISLSEQMARRKFEKQCRALKESAPLRAAIQAKLDRRRRARMIAAVVPFAFILVFSVLVWAVWGAR